MGSPREQRDRDSDNHGTEIDKRERERERGREREQQHQFLFVAVFFQPSNSLSLLLPQFPIAVKRWKNQKLSPDELQEFRREVLVLRFCNHANVVKVKETVFPWPHRGGQIYVVYYSLSLGLSLGLSLRLSFSLSLSLSLTCPLSLSLSLSLILSLSLFLDRSIGLPWPVHCSLPWSVY